MCVILVAFWWLLFTPLAVAIQEAALLMKISRLEAAAKRHGDRPIVEVGPVYAPHYNRNRTGWPDVAAELVLERDELRKSVLHCIFPLSPRVLSPTLSCCCRHTTAPTCGPGN